MLNAGRKKGPLAALLMGFILCLLLPAGAVAPVSGQTETFVFPSFRDPHRRVERPSDDTPSALRFLMTDDFPPFSYVSPDGQLVGFNVDLARAVCVAIDTVCFIQIRPWDSLGEAAQVGENIAIMAGIVMSPETQRLYAFTDRYLTLPARFMARKDEVPIDFHPRTLARLNVAVVKDSAHEAFVGDHFETVTVTPKESLDDALKALKADEVDLVFADGLRLSRWLTAGTTHENCCTLAGGPYLESAYFGHGLAIAVPRKDETLVQLLNYGLDQVQQNGVFEEIYLRHFPVGIY